MSDPKDEPTRRAREDAPDTRLGERLLARATQPLGLIDVRHTERRYARVMDWLAGRTSLVEHLRSRYGLTDDDIRAGTLVLAEARGSEGTDVTIILPTSPGVGGAAAAERLFTSVAHVPEDAPDAPAETRRVRRRGSPDSPPPSSETPPDAGARREAGGVTAPEPLSLGADRTRPLQAPVTVKTSPDAPAATPPATHGRAAPEAEAAAPPKRADRPLARAAELSPEKGATSPARAGVVGVGREVADANPSRVAEAPGAEPSAREAPAHARRRAAERAGAQSAGVMPEESEPILKRPVSKEAQAASEPRATTVSRETGLPLPRARELVTGGFGRERGVQDARSTLPLAAGSNNFGPAPPPQAPAAGVAPVTRQASTGGVEAPGAKGTRGKAAGVSVERLTEQVSRHLARRLLVERERRGLGKR
ncbi:MAG TPA: hypothetical protein VF570_20490 [Pyrinomonadaceae bacterium]|jgi:hypothetical protein